MKGKAARRWMKDVCRDGDVHPNPGPEVLRYPRVGVPKMERKLKFMAPKEVSRLSTWNVRTMYEAGKAAQVMKDLRQYRVQVAGLQEVRWAGEGDCEVEGYHILYSGRKDGKHHLGVACAMDEEAYACLVATQSISERVMWVRFRTGAGVGITVVVAHSPTEGSAVEALDRFLQINICIMSHYGI